MIRALLTFGINLVLAAVALLVVSFTTEGVTMQWSGLLWTVLVFALAQAVLAPFVFNLARKYASAVLGGIGIASTLLALWVATLASNGGLRINGLGAWVSTALIVWVITALGEWLAGLAGDPALVGPPQAGQAGRCGGGPHGRSAEALRRALTARRRRVPALRQRRNRAQP